MSWIINIEEHFPGFLAKYIQGTLNAVADVHSHHQEGQKNSDTKNEFHSLNYQHLKTAKGKKP
jgi:hypothetical protein